jgi:predicted DsbA family dithiol-disulfide isomerase
MITLEPTTEQLIRQAATESGLTIQTFLDLLIERYMSDKLDIQQADLALSQTGEISLDELKAKYDL